MIFVPAGMEAAVVDGKPSPNVRLPVKAICAPDIEDVMVGKEVILWLRVFEVVELSELLTLVVAPFADEDMLVRLRENVADEIGLWLVPEVEPVADVTPPDAGSVGVLVPDPELERILVEG